MSEGHIQRRGKRSWRIKYDLPRDESGERRLAYVTVKGTRKDAEKELRAKLSAIDHGMHVDPSNLTLAEYLETWLEMVAPSTVAPMALERYHSLTRNQIKPHLGSIQLQKPRPAHVSRWHNTLIGEGKISNRTIQHAHGVLQSALGYAAKTELVERNVATIIKPPKAERPTVASLTESQLVETIEKLRDHPIYSIAATAIGTGARRGEIVGLMWFDVDLEARTVTIQRSIEQTKNGIRVKPPKTKAGKRTISLPKVVVDALRDHRRRTLELRLRLGMGALPPDAPVFANLDGGWTMPNDVTADWRAAVKACHLPKITFHGLRHSHASALIREGVDIVTVSHRLGHQNPALTLSTYSHLFSDDDSIVVEKIDALLG